MSTSLYFANIGGHAVNVGDISVVAPARDDQRYPTPEHPADGVRITFRSKGNSVYIPGLTPEEFMDRLAESVDMSLPD